MSRPSLNIVLFGETGVGKSSLINLIAGRQVAKTSPNVQDRTMSFKLYSFPVAGRTLHIWDTVGLQGPKLYADEYLPAAEQAYELIHDMVRRGGVDLLLFCIRGGQATVTTQLNYQLFYEGLCRSQVPIVVVITHLEREVDMEAWWLRNADSLMRYGMKFAGHACITGLPSHSKYTEARHNMKNILEENDNACRFTMPSEKWVAEFLHFFRSFAALPEGAKQKDVIKYLTKKYGVDLKEYAEEEGQSSPPEAPRLPIASSSSLNIVLFGETGVGKSSVINLMAGKQIAATSPDVQGCTMSFQQYTFSIAGRTFHIWDTVGLEEPEIGIVGYLPAIEQACELIHNLVREGGIDLLLFCIRGNRIQATTQSNYRLFYEVLCRSKVPISAIVTHLEKETEMEMESWWLRNAEGLKNYGMKFAGHACVTGLLQHTRYSEAKRNMEKLLADGSSAGRFTMPSEIWFIEFLRYFGLFVPLPEGARRKDVIKCLTKRCRLDPKIANELADSLEGHRRSFLPPLWPKKIDQQEDILNLTEKVIKATRRVIDGNTSQYTVRDGNTRHTVAVKFVIGLNKHKKYNVNLKRRVGLHDKTIVPLFGVVDKPMPGIVTRWYAQGSLSNYLLQRTSLSLEEKKVMLGDVAVGLRYLHNQTVVHGNLHSNNILISADGICCLTDLAFTLPDKFIGASWLRDFSHESLRFADPKLVMWAQNAPDQVISPSKYCDIYSFGGVILHVLFGTKPYSDLGRLDILEKLLLAERPEIPSQTTLIPPGYEALINDCWDDDDEKRPSAMSFINKNWFTFR